MPPGSATPFYVDAVGRLPTLDLLVAVLFPGIFCASLVSLVLRFRRSAGVERQQVKWVVFGLGVALIGLISTMFSSDETILSAVIGGGTFLLFPLSIGVAILRFHLYDLDVVIRKTVIFATVVVSVTAFYLILVVLLPTAVLGVGSGVDTGMVLLGVAIGLLVSPIRTRARRFANRLVYGNRATPYEVLSEFSERVGGAYSDEDVLPRMVRVLGEGVGPNVRTCGSRWTTSSATSPCGPMPRPAGRRSRVRTGQCHRSTGWIACTRWSRRANCSARLPSENPRTIRSRTPTRS